MDKVLQDNGVPRQNCVGVGVDNTSVDLGKRNSIMTRAVQKHSVVYFMGCPCHIVHNMASEIFTQVS